MTGAPHQLTTPEARRIAVRAQLLDTPRPADILDAVEGLTLLQIDPIAAVAPSADLVLWSRLGSAYSPGDLTDLLRTRALVELQGMIRPAGHVALYRADMDTWPNAVPASWREAAAAWVDANDACRRDILERLGAEGPLPARALPDTCAKPWKSSGWTNDRNVEKLLGFLVMRGEVAVSGREGRERLWDLADRVYPDEPAVPADEALRVRAELRLGALGIAREKGPEQMVEPGDVGTVGVPVAIEGVKGTWRADPELFERRAEPLRPRAALLSPLDRLVYDRRRALELFDFDYQLEMYKPAAKRRWGYYALPILWGERLVGKLDAKADRKAGLLHVHAVHEDLPFTPEMSDAVNAEITDLARWLGLEVG